MARTIEEKRKADRERWKKRYHTEEEFKKKYLVRRRLERTSSEENIKKNRKRSKDYYESNRDERNEKRKEWGRKNKLRKLAYQRELYGRNREENAAKASARKDRLNPARVIRRLCRELDSGSIGLDEFARKVREQTIVANERLRKRIRLAAKRVRRNVSAKPSD